MTTDQGRKTDDQGPPSTADGRAAGDAGRGNERALVFGLWSLVLLALGLRLALWAQPLHEPANDEVEYIAVARDLLAGRGWVFYDSYRWLRAPLYPLFLAGSLWLAGGDLHRAALPNIALSVANVLLAYRLARALLGAEARRGAPLLAAGITALLWTSATFASLYMAETLFTFLFQAGLLALLRAARGIRTDWRWAAAAGLLLGLAALTRSAILMFLPVIALWIVWRSWSVTPAAPWKRRVAQAALGSWSLVLAFLAAAALPIAPWTIRNAMAYGEPILIETGLSYNLWAFSEPRESMSQIHRALEAIPNPVDRADYATARGLERLREDPLIVARKLWPNWVFLTRVKPIQDRFLLESYYASVELPLFAAALLFDDLLYVAVALAAIAGLARRPHPLALAWIGYCLVTMLLTHGEARYRHFFFPVLIPFAAQALLSIRGGKKTLPSGQPLSGAPATRRALVAALWALFLWTTLTSYPWDWAGWNLGRGWHTLAGDVRWAAGDRAGALASYERAINAYNVPDAWLRLGHARRADGDLAGAAEAYRRAWRREPLYYPASAWYGDALRELGDERGARDAFAGSFADPARVADYAWRSLRPAPRGALDVGGGLDPGYVDGLFPAEELDGAGARWSGGRAHIRLHAAGAGPATLALRMAAPRPDGATVAAEVCAGASCRAVTLTGAWRTYLLPVELPAAGDVTVTLRSPTFRAADGRDLGVLVDSAALRGR